MFAKGLFLVLTNFFLINTVFAQEYIPLAPLPGVSDSGANLSEYLAAIFNIGIGLAAVLAVLMIVVGGVQYIGGAASQSARSDAKKKIQNAVFGLLLTLMSWLIVYTINPNIIGGSLGITPVIFPTPVSFPPQVSFPPTPIPSLPPKVPTTPPPPPPIPTPPPQPIPSIPPGLPPIVLSNPSNDYLIMRDCLGQPADDTCALADIDSSGNVNGSDFSLFLGSFIYDVNGDGIIEFGSATPITYCSFKTNSESIPRPFCVDGVGYDDSDGIDNRFNVPCEQINTGGVPLFKTQCATDIYNDTVFSISEFSDFKQAINMSLSNPSRVNLRQLYSNLFGCGEDDDCYFDNNKPFIRITYATMVAHDSNGDGFADFGGDEPQSDFNDDGLVNAKDDDFAEFLNENIFITGQSPFVPFNFILGRMEAFLFDNAGFSDRQVIEYCIGKTPIMHCAMADVNKDLLVNSLDLTEFENDSLPYDINGDGVVNIFAP